MSIPELLPYIQFLGQMALIAAASFAGYQLIIHRKERTEQNAMEILTRMTTAEFRQAYAHIWSLPLDASAQYVAEQGKEVQEAVDCVTMTFEMMGVMVHNRMVPLDQVDQVIGGFLRESWRRTRSYILWQREQHGNKRMAEWYQWLAEHLAHDTRRSVGAYEAFKNWRE